MMREEGGPREMKRERMKRERENNDVSARWQPSGRRKNKLCFPAEVVPVSEP